MERERRLKKAAFEGNTQELREICRGDREILSRVRMDSFGETLLHVAALRGHTEFVRELLFQNRHLADYLDSTESSALHLASVKGYVPIVEALFFANPDNRPGMCLARDRDGFTPLHLAAKKGMVEVLKILVGYFPYAATMKLHQVGTALHLCVKHFQIECLKLLMEAMIPGNVRDFINARDAYGNTILHLAVFYEQTETVKYLLTYDRIYVNATNRRLNTALDVLDQSRREVRDGDIRNALQEAGALKYFPLAAEVEALFVENPGMWPDKCLARDWDGFTPIHLAAKNGMVEVLKILVRYFPYAVEVYLYQGGTVLHLCVEHFQIESLKLLMEAVNERYFINARDYDGNTILHLAVFYEQTETVKYLLRSDKIDVSATNDCQYTALDVSRREVGDGDIRKALQERVFSEFMFMREHEFVDCL